MSFTGVGVDSRSDLTIFSDKSTAGETDVSGDKSGSKGIFLGRPRFRFGGSVGSSRLENWTLACCAGVI